jgi:hemerythrin-like domain-containing protein
MLPRDELLENILEFIELLERKLDLEDDGLLELIEVVSPLSRLLFSSAVYKFKSK